MRATARVTPLRDIIKHLGMRIQHGVHKSHGRLADREPLLVNPSQDGCKHRRSSRGTANKRRHALVEDHDVVRDGCDVRVRAPNPVVDAAVLREAAVVDALVERVPGIGAGEVVLDGLLLVVCALVDVAEPAARGERGHGDFFVLAGVGAEGEVAPADGGEVGTGGREVRGEDFPFRPEALSGGGIAIPAFDAGVAGCDDDGDTLQAEFHPLGALAALVRDGEVSLGAAVRDGENLGGLVDAALELAFVAAVGGIGVRRVQRGDLAAVGSIDSIQKGVQKATEVVVCCVIWIICLKENGVLRPDDRIRDLKVQVGFGPCIGHAGWGLSAVDGLQDGMSALGNLPGRVSHDRTQQELTYCANVEKNRLRSS